MKSLGEKHRYFERPKGLGEQYAVASGAELETLLLAPSAAAACARGLELVQALRPEDFCGSEGAGEEAQDFYAVQYAGRRLRVGLRPYGFPGRPLLLMVAIVALPDTSGAG